MGKVNVYFYPFSISSIILFISCKIAASSNFRMVSLSPLLKLVSHLSKANESSAMAEEKFETATDNGKSPTHYYYATTDIKELDIDTHIISFQLWIIA